LPRYLLFRERFVFSLIMVVGVIIMSIFIGLITDSVNDYMDGLRLGRYHWPQKLARITAGTEEL